MDQYKTLIYPLMGEKATMLREKENKLSFIVDKKSSKKEVKEAVETLYNVKVTGVQTAITSDGRKKAHVKLDKKDSAEEVASRFGVL